MFSNGIKFKKEKCWVLYLWQSRNTGTDWEIGGWRAAQQGGIWGCYRQQNQHKSALHPGSQEFIKHSIASSESKEVIPP